ncbi:MAG TPA: MCE family protein [Nocardioides sp.]|nr:MCE family protein [Nocardioides sp.]
MTTRFRTAVAGAVALVLGVMLSGCGLTMGDLPIPGTGVSGDTMQVKADFRDALNLAHGAPVKVNGVDAGKVDSISEKNFTAEVTLTIRKDAELHQGATARLRYTTPLGELFVDVKNPTNGALLTDGAQLSLKDTDTAPTVEDALSEASLLINGGGLGQLQTVTEELNTALNGHEGDYRALLEKARTFLTQANATTGSVDKVLTSLNSLSQTLNARKDTINRAVREIRPAAHVLREQTPAFTKLLKALDRFAGAANTTVNATRGQLLRMLKELQPVLAEFAKNKGRWRSSLISLVNASKAADKLIANDYLNIHLNLHLDGMTGTTGLLAGVAGLLQTLGLGSLLNSTGTGLLGGILGGATASHHTSAGTKGSGGSGGTSGTSGLGGLLGNLLGGL